ncbi:UDP-glucuronosyltransferase 2A3-like, partial [Sipha flava]|uniref:UDP-glucuronosyltransferase n=1 Tax=Sipha flava TaxID=143950 RepID=A0A8B8G8H0_9HEMI
MSPNNGSATAVLVALLCVAALVPAPATGAMNVLAVQTVAGKSHWNVMSAVLRALTDRGHNVTVFTPFLDGDRDRYTEVHVRDGVLMGAVGMDAMELIRDIGTTSAVMTVMANFTRASCETIFQHPRMADTLRNGSGSSAGFDVVVIEPMLSECVSYVATELRVPLIYVVPSPILTYLERSLFGHVPNPAVVAHVLSSHGVPKTFTERLTNTLLTVHCSLRKWYAERRQRLSNPQPFDRVDLVKPSLTFTNTHFITEPARPLTQDIVQIGGIHLAQPKGIPKDILEFIEGSPHGVIYFTFGSVVLMSSLPEHVQNAFKEVLAQVPQRVLWKYEGEMKDKPDNVMTNNWFPQRDVLLHPKVKLFISHGGISGVYEAVDAGVPVLGFPFYFDQPRNLENLVDAGMAISMD